VHIARTWSLQYWPHCSVRSWLSKLAEMVAIQSLVFFEMLYLIKKHMNQSFFTSWIQREVKVKFKFSIKLFHIDSRVERAAHCECRG